ncbi:MAG: VanW family protein [Clostridia bacterium]|nr:VanW family protein [Clostridia bacterium]
MNRQNPTRRHVPIAPPVKRFPWWTIGVIVICGCVLFGAYVFAENQRSNYDRFHTMRTAVSGDVFFGPVFVDDVPLAGKTMSEAKTAISEMLAAQNAGVYELFLEMGNQRFRLSSADIPMQWNTDELLQKAYSVGRKGSLEQRIRQVDLISEPIFLASAFTYDREAVREIVDRVALELHVPEKDATVVAFDVANRTFTYTDEVVGQRVDGEKLLSDVYARLDAKNYNTPVQIPLESVKPLITRSELERNYTRIAAFSTQTTDDASRNENIRLSAAALNGAVIMPGGTISFNETTGERTLEKGYREAPAIESGRTVMDVGGGVCQTSTTLFNALVRAGALIETRRPHAWPSTYVPRGEDATVDWPRLDLVMKNPGSMPMFIAAWYENRKVTVEIYGYSLGEGVRIDLESVTTYEKVPTEVVYTYNPNLSVGTTKQLKKPHTGYSVQTYKLLFEDDREVQREPFYKSEYPAIYEEYEYNDGKPPA